MPSFCLAGAWRLTSHQFRRHPVPLTDQLVGQLVGRFRSPTQRRHRRPPSLWVHQRIQSLEQTGLSLHRRFGAPTRRPLPPKHLSPRLDLVGALGHRRTRHPRQLRHLGPAATTQHDSRRPHQQAPPPLIQMRQNRLQKPCQSRLGDLHTTTLHRESYSGALNVNPATAPPRPGPLKQREALPPPATSPQWGRMKTAAPFRSGEPAHAPLGYCDTPAGGAPPRAVRGPSWRSGSSM